MTIRWLIELDGVIFDPWPGLWAAYTIAAQSIDTPKTSQKEFERLLRIAAPVEQLVRYARPVLAARFSEEFARVRESDDCLAMLAIRQDAAAAAGRLGRVSDRVAVTCHSNRAARQRACDTHQISARFFEMQGLSTDPRRRGAEVTALAADAPTTIVIASSAEMARSAEQAGLPVIGVSGGLATPRRLKQAGCAFVDEHLGPIATDLENGARRFIEAGIHIAP